MKTTSSFFNELLIDEDYFIKTNQFVEQPINCIKQTHRLSISLLMACLRRQLQTDIGRGLVYRILDKQALLMKITPDHKLWLDSDWSNKSAEGNRLLSTIIPGKKSAVVRIITHYAKLSFSDVDALIGLCAYWLFTRLVLGIQQQEDIDSLLFSDNEIIELSPELTNKDYLSIGVYPWLHSSSHYMVPQHPMGSTASYL
jgi:hypothetical protein